MAKSICIVISDYYKEISDGLEIGAIKFCDENSIKYKKIYVPGALEIGPAIKIISGRDSFDGFIAIGCVIRGETSHFDIVTNESARAITNLNLDHSLLIANAILTVENKEQLQPIAPLRQIKIISFKDKDQWELCPKYNIGNGTK